MICNRENMRYNYFTLAKIAILKRCLENSSNFPKHCMHIPKHYTHSDSFHNFSNEA